MLLGESVDAEIRSSWKDAGRQFGREVVRDEI
jgi:hypothetical protein